MAWDNSKHLLSCTVYVGLEFGSGFAGQFCLRTSHEMGFRYRPGLQSSEGLAGAVRSASKVAHSHGKLVLVVGRSLRTSPHGPLHRQLECPDNRESDFLQSRWSKRARLKWPHRSALLSLGGDHRRVWTTGIIGSHPREWLQEDIINIYAQTTNINKGHPRQIEVYIHPSLVTEQNSFKRVDWQRWELYPWNSKPKLLLKYWMKNELFSPLFPLGLKLIELQIWVVNTLPLTWGQEIKPTENPPSRGGNSWW